MSNKSLSVTLSCPTCSWKTVCSREAIIERLLGVGMLRREAEPEEELLKELVQAAAPQLECPECGRAGLLVRESDEDADGEWQEAILCEVCGRPIPPERLEALPEVIRCVDCQHDSEQGHADTEPDYCPKCGALMVLRVSRAAGITRYKLFCTASPPCRV